MILAVTEPAVWAALITAIGAAIIVPIVNTIQNNAKLRNDSKLTELQLTLDTMKSQLQRLEGENARLDQDNSNLRVRVMHLEGLQDQLPFPQWHLDRNWRYVWVNKATELELLGPLGKTADDVIGKSATEVWPPEIAAKLKEIDSRAMHSGTRRAFGIGFSFGPDIPGTFHIAKFPVFSNNKHTGWTGLAIPEEAGPNDLAKRVIIDKSLTDTRSVINALSSDPDKTKP
jgi:hypothetical protein